MIVAAIFVAAGSGQRLAAPQPKAFVDVAGMSLLEHALTPFAAHPCVRDIVVVAPASHVEVAARLVPFGSVVVGGATRQESVRAGLDVVAPDVDVVLVHDVARAFVPPAVIDRVLAALDDPESGVQAAIPARPVSDTIKQVVGDDVVATIDRSRLRAVQTPQGFQRAALVAAHERSESVTDDAALIEAAGGRVVVVEGADEAFKVTHPWDLMVAEALLARRASRVRSLDGGGATSDE